MFKFVLIHFEFRFLKDFHESDYPLSLASDFSDVESRVPARIVGNALPQARFFGTFNLLSSLLSSLSYVSPFSTITTTILATSTSKMTVTAIQSCIGSGQFVSTTACSRKRRGIEMEEMQALELIAPSQVET